MSGRLTTEVIDTLRGTAAAGMLVDLFVLPHGGRERHHLKTMETATADAPVLEPDAFAAGTYELLFHVGRYFKANRATLGDAPFIDVLPIRFTVVTAERDHRVTLLVNPWCYTACVAYAPGAAPERDA